MARHARTQETRDRILDGALESYTDAPDQRLSVQALAERSGVSVGSIYHHFGSLDGVATALQARCQLRLLAELAEALQGDPPPYRGIHLLVRAHLNWTKAHRQEALFLHTSGREGRALERQEELERQRQDRREVIQRWVLAQVHAGHFVELPQALYEPLLLGPLAHIARGWLADPEALGLDEVAGALPDRIWGALTAK